VVERRDASLADGYRCPLTGLSANMHSEPLSVRVGKLPAVDVDARAYGPQV
jgi:hypothetical protein